METTFQPSYSVIRSKITTIEAIELSVIGFLFTALTALIPTDTPMDLMTFVIGFFVLEAFLLGSWAIYLAYIRLTRGLHRRLDIRLRFLLAFLTSTYTLWAWIILDINRWLIARLLYRGEAPVEYAWSSRSKQARKEWEQANKLRQVYLSL
jgi:hypothetical protein